MKKGLIITLLFSLISILGYYGIDYVENRLVSGLDNTLDEAKRFAKDTDKNGCISEFVRQYKNCDGIACMSAASTFSAMCFANAEGDLSTICKPAVQPNENVNMFLVCADYGLNEPECEHLYRFYDAVCSNAS
ncbi:hypothetical protein [Enterovibrio calviensis]|uniref:hypothetical protein n=1 Tax=Enterovibrio calviensis TaxID=91359 RepID=UPI003735BCBB